MFFCSRCLIARQVVKQRDPATGQRSLLFQLHYPSISESVQPRHRFMSTFEQNVEKRDEKIQYLLVAAEPYETVAFKIPNQPIDRSHERFFTHWDPDANLFYLQFYFALDEKTKAAQAAAAAGGGQPDDAEMDEGEANYEIEEGDESHSP
jgi:splicing factor 3A subunit 2